jgi:hypothetical protein
MSTEIINNYLLHFLAVCLICNDLRKIIRKLG